MAVEQALQVRGLRRSFAENVAVDDVSFSIAPGETYGLLGPNGAGKTTTISMVCGLLVPDAGEVLVLGGPLTQARKSLIGLVPQDLALYPDLSVLENLRFFGRLQGLDGARLTERIEHVLDVVGLSDRAKDRVETYSGGMKRRANIAVGLLHEPSLLILDEPTVGVDPQSRNSILESVDELGSKGLAVLYTTHYMEEAERVCDRVGIIDDGRLIAEGTCDELVDDLTEQTKVAFRLVGADQVVDALVDRVGRLDGVIAARRTDDGIDVLTADGPALIAPVVQLADSDNITVAGVELQQPDLESVFLHLTGKALRD